MTVSKLGYSEEYQGKSSDTKPTTGVVNGSTFLDIDSKTLWVYDSNNVNPATGNGWW